MNWPAIHGEAFRGKRVLVTGAAGFIGSHLVEALAALGAKVVALDDLSRGTWENLKGFDTTVEKATASILDRAAIEQAVGGCAYVFHQAALGSVPASLDNPLLYHGVNVLGTVSVLEAAWRCGVRRVIFASSSSAYGDPPQPGPREESAPPMPLSPYAATKIAGEAAMHAWVHSYALDTVSLRYFNVFGPRQDPNSAYAAVIAAFAKAMQAGRSGTIFGDGRQTRDFTYVDNVVHANLLAARRAKPLGGQVINVAMGRQVSVNELHEQMAELHGLADAQAIYQPPRRGDVLHSLADISRARRELDYKPLVDFREGLQQTVDWYRQRAGQLI
jgi:nucleoside-diphosphate-sugar epimerase